MRDSGGDEAGAAKASWPGLKGIALDAWSDC